MADYCNNCHSSRLEFSNLTKCDIGHPSADLWDKFEFDLLTPPHSPEHVEEVFSPGDDIDNLLSPHDSEDPDSDDFCNEFFNDFSHTFPDLKEAVYEYFENNFAPTSDGASKLRQDCMWNGRNDPRNGLSHRRSRSNSPASLSSSLGSGCIDPESLFNSSQFFTDRIRTASGTRCIKIEKEPETPSDSEEEVDVVSLEKKPTLQSAASNINISTGTKLLGTIVQQNGIHSHLALISSTDSDDINKTGAKTVSMLIPSNKTKPTSKKTFQLKCFPIIKATVPSNQSSVSKQKNPSNSNDNKSAAVFHLMRLTSSPALNPPASEKENTRAAPEKRRVCSLDGVSMVSDTGIKRAKSQKKPFLSNTNVKKEPLAKRENNSSALLAEMKKPRKCTKRSAAPDYESPTSSPGSCDSLDFSPPKRRTSGGRSSGSSSGSDEDSIRVAHNVLERQRREDLRNLYHVLRREVPEVTDNERAPKVLILTKAKECIESLQDENTQLQFQRLEEERRMCMLQQRIRDAVSKITFSKSPRSRISTIHDPKTERQIFSDNYAYISN